MPVDMTYSFLSDDEPTDEQLEQLMREVGEEARETNARTLAALRESVWVKMARARKESVCSQNY